MIHGQLDRLQDSIHLKTRDPDYKIAVIYVFDHKDEIMKLWTQEHKHHGLPEYMASRVDECTAIASRLNGVVDVFIKVKNPVDPEKHRSLESIKIHPDSDLSPVLSNPPDWSDIRKIFIPD